MGLKEMYKYVYYKVYKSMCLATDWGADWRASGVLLIIGSLFPYSFFLYYRVFVPNSSPIERFELYLLPGVVLYIIDYFIFHSKEQWKSIIEKYEAWPRKKNFRGTFIVWGCLSLVIINFAISMYLFEKIVP